MALIEMAVPIFAEQVLPVVGHTRLDLMVAGNAVLLHTTQRLRTAMVWCVAVVTRDTQSSIECRNVMSAQGRREAGVQRRKM